MTVVHDRFELDATPMRIDTVRLKVRDLERVSGFYQSVLGLTALATSEGRVTLGTSRAPLLHLDGDPDLRPRDPRRAGLFHTAFLMPSRADLARWLAHAGEAGVALQGASDHVVSEAIYLADPEGNGIEVYADRPPSQWRDSSGGLRMSTAPLDTRDLRQAAGDTRWRGFPDDGVIGHVHLQVGDTEEAERFHHDVLGFDVTCRYAGAVFFGSGGYHHQLAANVWNSPNAGPRDPSMAGLAEITLRVAPAERDAIVRRTGGERFTDPWGTAFAVTG